MIQGVGHFDVRGAVRRIGVALTRPHRIKTADKEKGKEKDAPAPTPIGRGQIHHGTSADIQTTISKPNENQLARSFTLYSIGS